MVTDTPPKDDFSNFHFYPRLLQGIQDAGFTAPRPIQVETIPHALEGRDVLGLAQTGTGKTAAFALPILNRLVDGRTRGPSALIIAPTRELVQQINTEFLVLSKHLRVRTQTIYGGVSARVQIDGLRRRPDIIVACPGRLLDLYQQRYVRLNSVETLVLDEADHMFDMGFLPDIKRILAALPSRRQNLLFSATMPRELRRLADTILVKPHVVELASSAPAATVEHALYPIPERHKIELLRSFLEADDFNSAIIFSRTKHRAKRLALQLRNEGYRAISLQGNMSQAQRDFAMAGFRSRKFNVLVATDIAARGIDVAKVSHVINFDMPNTPEAYTHRIGRTGRAECSGKAITFVTEGDRKMVYAIERRLGAQIARRAPDGSDLPAETQEHRPRRSPGGYRRSGHRSPHASARSRRV